MSLGSVIYFLFQLTSRFHSILCTHLLLYFKGIFKKLNFGLISDISTYFTHSNLPYVLFIWQSNNLYQKGSFKKLICGLIRTISTNFIHSNLPYVLFIWQSNNLYQKQLYFQRNFLENLPQIHKIYFKLLRQSSFSSLKSTHSRQIWSSIDKDILG